MRQIVAVTLSVVLCACSVGQVLAASADTAQVVTIPEPVSSNILKRHPGAQDMKAVYETHFGQKLLQVSFKDEKGFEAVELFTGKNHLYGNVLVVEDLSEILPPVVVTLKKEFPQHVLQRVELIVNPNSAGEEYEIYLQSDNSHWKLAITDKGTVIDKQQLMQ